MDIREAAAAYESATQFFLNLARGVTPDLLDVHHESGWSARQIIHHLADSEAQSYARLRRLVAEPEVGFSGMRLTCALRLLSSRPNRSERHD